jgi:hypothetical protein
MNLFTKTYIKDAELMRCAVKTVNHFVQEDVFWTVVAEAGEIPAFKDICKDTEKIGFELVSVEEKMPGAMAITNPYMRQQWVKMNAHKFFGEELAWNWDSDCIAMKDFSEKNFFSANRPVLWRTDLNTLILSGYPSYRKQLLMELFGKDPGWECMRCMPLPLDGKVLAEAEKTQLWKTCFQHLKIGDSRFSEFCVIGCYEIDNFPNRFTVKNTDTEGPTWQGEIGQEGKIIHQSWSWGPMENKFREFVEKLK